MFKNKSPFSHTNQNNNHQNFSQLSNNYPTYQGQSQSQIHLQQTQQHTHQRNSRSPISVDIPQQSNMMFTQTLVKNKNRNNVNGYNDNNNGNSNDNSLYKNNNINTNTGGFGAINMNMNKKNMYVDIDMQLGCDQVLHKNKPSQTLPQLQFMCNEQLTPISITTSKPITPKLHIPTIQQNRRFTQRRQNNPSSIPLLDLLKCNQQLPEKQNLNVGPSCNNTNSLSLDQIHKKTANILQNYQKIIIEQKDQILKLRAQIQGYRLKNY